RDTWQAGAALGWTAMLVPEEHGGGSGTEQPLVDLVVLGGGVRRVLCAGAALGGTAMLGPEEHGGGSVTEQPLVDLVVLAEELGRVLYPGPFVPTNVVVDALVQFGSRDQQQEL